ncbi:hypothetical protein L6164_032155 [Bauhinia variegata]|uniref:Uncharacterized protein n=1 Tax=Bauhinia variegata TaxID=167791 RepID=A0ACB9KMX5_BAUVA|nr:hypothetical protein L6164_032155 [Bauhinia variegata]
MTMASLTPVSFLCLLLTLISHATADDSSNIYLNSYCGKAEGTYTTYSVYKNNLNTLLRKLSSNTGTGYGFYSLSYGQKPNQIYATGLCRGDVKPSDCQKCLDVAGTTLRKECPNEKKATGYDNKCTIRYSPKPLFGVLTLAESYYMCNQNDTPEVEEFDQVLTDLISKLTGTASSGDTRHKYAESSTTGPTSETVYANAQCTPELSKQQCSDCLHTAFSYLFDYCEGKRGGRYIGPSCNFRYEFYRFYGPKAQEPPNAAPLKVYQHNFNF